MSNVVSWCKTSEFEILVEPYEEVIFLHMNVSKWSKTVIQSMIEILKEIEFEMAKLGYVYILMCNCHQTRAWIKLVTKYAQGHLLGIIDRGIHVYGKELKWVSN